MTDPGDVYRMFEFAQLCCQPYINANKMSGLRDIHYLSYFTILHILPCYAYSVDGYFNHFMFSLHSLMLSIGFGLSSMKDIILLCKIILGVMEAPRKIRLQKDLL